MPRSTSERSSYGLAGAGTPMVPPGRSGGASRVLTRPALHGDEHRRPPSPLADPGASPLDGPRVNPKLRPVDGSWDGRRAWSHDRSTQFVEWASVLSLLARYPYRRSINTHDWGAAEHVRSIPFRPKCLRDRVLRPGQGVRAGPAGLRPGPGPAVPHGD